MKKYCRVRHTRYGYITLHMRTERWIPKATNTHLQYLTLTFLLQLWLHEHAPLLRYMSCSSL
jgi:hypothetical protein